jgi:hypothetical protein
MKATGNMYEDVGQTWNPLAGKCLHQCKYCSTNKLMRFPVIREKYSGNIRLDEKQLNRKFDNKEETIFVVAQNDLFAENVPEEFILKILARCDNPFKTYFFQSKNPTRMIEFADRFPEKTILCTTIESSSIFVNWERLYNCNIGVDLFGSYTRFNAFKHELLQQFDKQITIEPIIKFSKKFAKEFENIPNLKQVNIGANTYKKVQLPEPTRDEILNLIAHLETFTVVKQKSNLTRLTRGR